MARRQTMYEREMSAAELRVLSEASQQFGEVVIGEPIMRDRESWASARRLWKRMGERDRALFSILTRFRAKLVAMERNLQPELRVVEPVYDWGNLSAADWRVVNNVLAVQYENQRESDNDEWRNTPIMLMLNGSVQFLEVTKFTRNRSCGLCDSPTHTRTECVEYWVASTRFQRALELGLCDYCGYDNCSQRTCRGGGTCKRQDCQRPHMEFMFHGWPEIDDMLDPFKTLDRNALERELATELDLHDPTGIRFFARDASEWRLEDANPAV